MPRTTSARKAASASSGERFIPPTPTRVVRVGQDDRPATTGSTLLQFVEALPPSRKLGREASAYFEEAAELKAHKGMWAVLKTFDKPSGAGSLASAVKNGKYAAFAPAGSFEAVSRTTDDGKGCVYVRYVG